MREEVVNLAVRFVASLRTLLPMTLGTRSPAATFGTSTLAISIVSGNRHCITWAPASGSP